MSFELLITIAIIALMASVVKSAFGFGEGLVNMSMLSFLIPLELSGPYVAIISVIGSSFIVIREWKILDFRSIKVMVIGSLIFAPIGIWLTSITDAGMMKLVLGLLIAAFSLYSLFNPKLGSLKNEKLALIFGGMGGVLAGAYNIPGPPVAIYGSLRNWAAPVFRVNLQAYFACTSLFVLIGHVINGNVNNTVFQICSIALPAVFTGIFIGKRINRSLKNPVILKKIIYVILTLIGITLAIS